MATAVRPQKSAIRNPQSEIEYSGGTSEPGTRYLIDTVQDLLDLNNPDNFAGWDTVHYQLDMLQWFDAK